MAGNRQGGLKSKKTIIEKYGRDFYRKAGSKGGNPLLLAIRDKNNGKKQESPLPAT